jgi:ATP-dependent Lon protease
MNETNNQKNIVLASEILPENLIVTPIKTRPVFPNTITPVTFSGEDMIKTIEKIYNSDDKVFGIVYTRKEADEDYEKDEYYQVGTAMKIYRIIPMGDNAIQVLAQGLRRFTFKKTVQEKPHMVWNVEYYYEPDIEITEEIKAYALSIMSNVKELLKINPLLQEQLKMMLQQLSYDQPTKLIDMVASILTSNAEKLQDLLETFDLVKRAEKLIIMLREEIEVSQIQEKIQKQIDEKVNKQQKEFFLREQLKAIKKELGLEKDDKSTEIEKIEKRLKKLKPTEEAEKVIREEMEKLKVMEATSAEYNVTRSYLETLTELPWGIFSKENTNIKKARKILDDQHYGLNDVKDRILEFISTIIKRKKLSGSIICLVGPPGVGKTSIGKSIADALGREFYRFSLGGMRDEAEIKGHRRTYIGAMPGKFIQSLKRTQTSNPVIMLDEIDKIGTSFQGDPASALLEVLDPEQNKEFLDHYLDVRYDLSNVLFVTTANQLDTIPRPLLDRMEIIKLSGYILEEKVQIAKRYLVPKQLEQHGLKKSEVSITDKALEHIIDGYAREAGVRSLENNIKKVLRKVTVKIAADKPKKITVNPKKVEQYLGKPLYTAEELYNKDVAGVALGLAWTALGGATLYIEANAVKGKNAGFKQTGQLGKVMQESSEIAYSYVRSLLSEKSQKNFFNENFVHLHVPAGATPKDGPSAGITMSLALYSLATGIPVRNDIAMTGELTLTGKVLPIGGVKEKTIAARRVGVSDLIFPKANKKDFDELPEYIKKGIKANFVDYFDDVLAIAFADKNTVDANPEKKPELINVED